MSKEIEEKVLQMKFDNEQFEDGAHQTIDTLGKLETSLQFENLSNSLDKAEKTFSSFNFGGIADKIKTIIDTVNPLSVIGSRALERITDSVYDYTVNTIKGFTGWNNVMNGWQKYGEEVQNVQTIMNATGEDESAVYKQLEKLAWFTDETSYNYDAMVANIARFNSAGVKLEPSVKAMIGIADMAGYFGVEANNATHAMEGFAKAIGAGYMSARNWEWIKTARMETEGIRKAFIDAAVEMGRLQKVDTDLYKTAAGHTFNLAGFTNELKDGWLDTTTMLAAFNKYGNATEDIFKRWEELGGSVATSDIIEQMRGQLDELGVSAFESSQAALTFKQAIESVNVAVSSKWRKSFQIIFGTFQEAKEEWTVLANELWDVFAAGGDRRNSILAIWAENGGRQAIMDAIENLWVAFREPFMAIREAWEEMFPIEEVAAKLTRFSEAFRDFTTPIREFFAGPKMEDSPVVEAVSEVAEACERVYGPVAKTTEVLDDLAWQVIRGDYGNGQTRIDTLRELGYSFELVQNKVNELLGVDYRYEVQQDEIVKVTNEVAEAGKQKAEVDKEMLRGMQEFSKEEPMYEKRLRYIQQAFKGLVSFGKFVVGVFKEIASRTGELIGTIAKNLMPRVDDILEALGKFGAKVSAFFDNIEIPEFVNASWSKFISAVDFVTGKLSEFAGWVGKNLGTAFGWVYEQIQGFFGVLSGSEGWGKLRNSLKKLWGMLTELWEGVKEYTNNNVIKKIKKYYDALVGEDGSMNVGGILGTFVDSILSKLADLIDSFTNAKDVIKDFFSTFVTSASEAFGGTGLLDGVNVVGSINADVVEPFKKFQEYFEQIWGWLQTAWTNIKNPFKAVGDWITDLGTAVTNFFTSLDFEKLSSILKDAGIGALFMAFADKIHNGAGTIADIPSNFNLVLVALRETLVDYQKKLNASYLLDLAKAVGIFTLSIIGLSAIPVSTLIDVMSVLTIAAVAVSGLAKAFAAWNNSKANLAKAQGANVIGDVFKSFMGDTTLTKVIGTVISPFTTFASSLAASIDKWMNGSQSSKAFLAIAAAVSILVYDIFRIINDIDFDKQQDSLFKATILLGALAGLMALAVNLAGKSSLGSAVGFIAIGAMINMLVPIIEEIISWEPDKIAKAAIVVFVLAGAMGALAWAMSSLLDTKSSNKTENSSSKSSASHPLVRFAVSVLILALALDLMMPAISMISQFDTNQINKVWGVIIAVGALMAAYTFLVLQLAKQKNSDEAAKSLTKMVAVLTALMAVVALMGAFDVNIGPGLLAMAAAMGILVMGIVAIDTFGVSDTLIKFGQSIANFGKGLLASIAAIILFCTFLPQIVNGIVALGETLQNENTRNALIAGVVALIGVMIAALLLTKTDIISAILTLVSDIANFIPSAFAKVGITILQSWPLLTWFLSTVIILLLGFIEGILPGVIDKLCDIIITGCLALAKTIGNRADEIVSALGMVIWAIVLALSKIIFQAIDSLFGDLWPQDDILNAIDQHIDNMNAEIDAKLNETGDNTATAVGKQKPKIESAMSDLTSGIENPLGDLSFDMDQMAEEMGVDLPEEVRSNMSNWANVGDMIHTSVSDPVKELITDLPNTSSQALSGMVSTVHTKVQNELGPAADTIRTTLTSRADPTSELISIAGAAVAGFVNSLVSADSLNAIGSAGLRMANVLTSAVASAKGLDEHSPSKATGKLATFAVLGFVNNIYDGLDMVKNAGIDVASALTNTIEDAMNLANSDMEVTPRITPLVDLRYAQNGAGELRSMMADVRGANLIAGIRFKSRAQDIQDSVNSAMQGVVDDIYGVLNDREMQQEYVFEAPVSIDGREVARATARYNRQELALLDRNTNRKGGKVR